MRNSGKEGVLYTLLITGLREEGDEIVVHHTQSLARARRMAEVCQMTLDAIGVDGKVEVWNSKKEVMRLC